MAFSNSFGVKVAMPEAPLRKWVELNLGKKTFLPVSAAAQFLKESNDSAAAGETEEEAKKRRKKEKKEKKEKKAKKEEGEDKEAAEEDVFFYLKMPPKEAGVVVEEAKRPTEAEVKVIAPQAMCARCTRRLSPWMSSCLGTSYTRWLLPLE